MLVVVCVRKKYSQTPTQVKEALQVKSVAGAFVCDSSEGVIHQEGVLEGGWPTHSNHVPLIVIECHFVAVPHTERSLPKAEDEVDMAVDQLQGQEVMACEKRKTFQLGHWDDLLCQLSIPF